MEDGLPVEDYQFEHPPKKSADPEQVADDIQPSGEVPMADRDAMNTLIDQERAVNAKLREELAKARAEIAAHEKGGADGAGNFGGKAMPLNEPGKAPESGAWGRAFKSLFSLAAFWVLAWIASQFVSAKIGFLLVFGGAAFVFGFCRALWKGFMTDETKCDILTGFPAMAGAIMVIIGLAGAWDGGSGTPVFKTSALQAVTPQAVQPAAISQAGPGDRYYFSPKRPAVPSTEEFPYLKRATIMALSALPKGKVGDKVRAAYYDNRGYVWIDGIDEKTGNKKADYYPVSDAIYEFLKIGDHLPLPSRDY